MEARDIVVQAHKIMKSGASLVSFNEDNYFWNEHFSGLNEQEAQDFNRFEKLKPSVHILQALEEPSNEKGLTMKKLFADHAEMTKELREALQINPDKKDHEKLVTATQFTFMLIIMGAIKCCGDHLL